MTVTSIRDAWAEVQKIFPTRYEHDASRSERAGYPIYYSTASGVNAWISDLGNRLEVNLPDGKSANIWIQAPAEATITSDSAEETEDDGSATKEERRETAKRIQRLAYFYTVEYVGQLDNKKREDAAVKEMQAAETEGGETKCMVLTAENNAPCCDGQHYGLYRSGEYPGEHGGGRGRLDDRRDQCHAGQDTGDTRGPV